MKQMLGGILIAGCGAAFVVAGWWGMAEVRPYAAGVKTTGVVVGNVEGSVMIDGVARPNYSPVFEFEPLDGERRRIVDHRTAGPRPLEVGSTVEVSYLPDDPSKVPRTDVDRSWLRWFVLGGAPVVGLGALIVLGSLASALRRLRSRADDRRVGVP